MNPHPVTDVCQRILQVDLDAARIPINANLNIAFHNEKTLIPIPGSADAATARRRRSKRIPIMSILQCHRWSRKILFLTIYNPQESAHRALLKKKLLDKFRILTFIE